MSEHIGFTCSSKRQAKHSDLNLCETEEVLDHKNNEMRSKRRTSKRKNKQTGSELTIGFGKFPKVETALEEGKICTTVQKRESTNVGIKYELRNVTPSQGSSASSEDEMVKECPPDPERPGLKFMRTRKRKRQYNDGDHVSHTSVDIGLNWPKKQSSSL